MNKHGKSLSVGQRRCILRYLKLHREQQKRERDFAARSILRAQEDIDESTRQPNRAHILIDAWTERNGDTPKVLLVMNSSTHNICPCHNLKTSNVLDTHQLPYSEYAAHRANHHSRSIPPYEDSVGDSTPPLQTIVQFTKLPHDSLNEDWHLGTTTYECLCRSFAFTEIP